MTVEDMTVAELNTARKSLQRDIRLLVVGFVDKTGMEVREVDVPIHENGGIGGGGRSWYIGAVSVRCDI